PRSAKRAHRFMPYRCPNQRASWVAAAITAAQSTPVAGTSDRVPDDPPSAGLSAALAGRVAAARASFQALSATATHASAQNTGYSKPPRFHSHLKPPTLKSAAAATNRTKAPSSAVHRV